MAIDELRLGSRQLLRQIIFQKTVILPEGNIRAEVYVFTCRPTDGSIL